MMFRVTPLNAQRNHKTVFILRHKKRVRISDKRAHYSNIELFFVAGGLIANGARDVNIFMFP